MSNSKPPKASMEATTGAWVGGIMGGGLAFVVTRFAEVGLVPGIIFSVIVAIIAAAYFGTKGSTEAAARGHGSASASGGTFAGITIYSKLIVFENQSQPLGGVHASVESAGQISRRPDVGNIITGAVLMGPLGAILGSGEKRSDDRELFLVVTGSKFSWVRQLNPNNGLLAQQFAARINTAAQRQSN